MKFTLLTFLFTLSIYQISFNVSSQCTMNDFFHESFEKQGFVSVER